MKCLIVLSALVSVALAKPGYLGAAGIAAPAVAAAAPVLAAPAAAIQPAAPVVVGGIHPGLAAYGPANIVVGPGGYNLDTPDVAAARAAHLGAVAQTRARDAAINGAVLAAAAAAAYAAPRVVAAPGVAAIAAPAVVTAPAPAVGSSVTALAPGLLGVPGALSAAKSAYHGKANIW